MKKILVTQRLYTFAKYNEDRDSLDVQWGQFFSEIGVFPFLFPSEYPVEKFVQNIEFDGLLLTGGNDLSSISNDEVNVKRDDYELKLIKYCISNNIPVLGVCRGMQIIAHYFGASLEKVDDCITPSMKYRANNKSRYYDYLKDMKFNNAYYNYKVSECPKNFIGTAESNKNNVAAFEYLDKILGIMWHPERNSPFLQADIKLFKSFFGGNK